jgi:lipopolysaccharide exporter
MTSTSDPPHSEVSDPDPGPAGSDSSALSTSVRKGALWLVASNLSLKLANLVLIAIVAHILSPHAFGVYAVAMTVYIIVWSLGELGVSSCLIRADLDIDSLAPTVTTIVVSSCAIFAGAMVAFARPIAIALGSADAAGPIRVMAIAVVLLGIFAVPSAQIIRDFRQDKIFLANAIGFVPATAVLIILAKSGGGALAFAWFTVVNQLFLGCALLVMAPRHYRPGLARSALSVVGNFGIPLAVGNFVSYILLNVDYAFVGHFLGAVELGLYMLAYTVASWPYGLLGSVLNLVGMPAFSRVKHDPDLLRNAMATAVRAVTLIVWPMCAMMIALAHPLIVTLYGAKWSASANVLVLLSVYAAVSMVCLLFINIIIAFGHTKTLLVLQLIWLGTLIPAMALGVHKDGIIGAAYAHVSVIIPIVLPSYLLVLRRVTGVSLAALGKAALPALLASAAAALAAHRAAAQFSSPLAQLAGGLAVGGVIYVIIAGQPAAAIFGRGRAAERVLNFYRAAARLAGLPAEGRGKHSLRYPPEGASPAVEEAGVLGWQPGASRSEGLASRANLTWAYGQEPWSAQAVTVQERTLADRARLLGSDHPQTVAARANLAYAYSQAGWPAKTIPLYERMVADLRRLLGPDHPRTLRSSSYLATAYREVRRLAEAIPLYEQTLAGWRRLLGPDHPSTLRCSNNLASAYGEAGRLAAAIPLYEQTLAGWRRLLGPDHLSTLRCSNNLASAYGEAGRLAEAVPLYEQTLARSARVLGSDHTLTRTVRRNLGVAQRLASSQSPYAGRPEASQASRK